MSIRVASTWASRKAGSAAFARIFRSYRGIPL
jgi:hypothetical protein